MSHVLADARDHPVMAPYHEHWRHAVDVLVTPWGARDRRRAQLRAAIAVALSFDTWRTLVRDQKLSQEQAIDVAAGFAA